MEPNDRKLRLAVVGCGAVAAIHHLPAISLCRSAEVAVLVDADAGRARDLAARFGVAETATDHRSLAGRVDAAIVAVPNSLHAPVTIELLRQGLHVLVEKPMAVTVPECDAMIAAAEAARAVLAVGLEFRFFDFSLLVRNLLRDGLLGKIRRFEMHLGVIPRWPFATDFLLRKETAGGGVLADLGVHVLDLLLWWLGDWADVEYRDDAQGGLESDCELLLACRSGETGAVRGTVEISRTHSLSNTCFFEGERASLRWGSGTRTRRSACCSRTARSSSPAAPGVRGARGSASAMRSCARSRISRRPSASAASPSCPAARGAGSRP
ncbi:MAG TPA: Gfo/Idh/MocA family oxidoreductase [Thermoanaerobaculia bacterium]|nr:Gfo/Idh/MocA family oxidoreductase [Thermoanaerobaculia bacterium]